MIQLFNEPLSMKNSDIQNSELKEGKQEKEAIERRLHLLMLDFAGKAYFQLMRQEKSDTYTFDNLDVLKSFTDDNLFFEQFYKVVRNYASVFEVPREITIAGFDLDRGAVLDSVEEARIMLNVELSKTVINVYATSLKEEFFKNIHGIENFIERSQRFVERAEYLQLNFADKVDYIIKHSEGSIYTPESFKHVLFEAFQEDNNYLIQNVKNIYMNGIRENTMTLHADLLHLVEHKVKSEQEDFYGSPLNNKGLVILDLKKKELMSIQNNIKDHFNEFYNGIPTDQFSHLIALDKKKSIVDMIREKIMGDDSNIDYSGNFKIFDDIKNGEKFTIDKENKTIFDFNRKKPTL